VQCSSAESDGNAIVSDDGTALLEYDILFVRPTPCSPVIYLAAEPSMIFMIAINHVQRNRKSKGMTAPKGKWSVSFEKAKIAHLNGNLNPVLLMGLMHRIMQAMPSGMNVSKKCNFH
jgi:hypothetical protein